MPNDLLGNAKKAPKFIHTLIGADPEFVLLARADGHLVTNPFTNILLDEGHIGTDHGGRVTELRPNPARYAFTICRRIKRMLEAKQTLTAIGNYRWRAGACPVVPAGGRQDFPQPIGGHIHIGIPRFSAEQDRAMNDINNLLLALDILPHDEDLIRRRHGYGAGNRDDIRECYEGVDAASWHVEHRVFPSWLHHPVAAMLTLTGAKIATNFPMYVPQHGEEALETLRNLFFTFRNMSKDIGLAYERIIEPVTRTRQLQFDPTVDFREPWARWSGGKQWEIGRG